MLWLLTQTVNSLEEFRTALTDQGVGIYDELIPIYTILNKEDKNFIALWPECLSNYQEFLKSYENDVAKYGNSKVCVPKENMPSNIFHTSVIPWFSFTSFEVNVIDEGKHLLPIFTMGKFFELEGKTLLPLSIQVHHAVCDGYHVGQFLSLLQDKIDSFDEGL